MPPPPQTTARRASRLVGQQWRAVLEPARLVAHAPALQRTPRGDGGPVVLLPGLTTGDVATAPLRAWLGRRGWDAHGWGLGTNDGRRELADEVGALVASLAARAGRPVGLVGWSLGGTIARSVAGRDAAHVDRVVTFGSPVFNGLPRSSRVPTTAIVSRNDGVVAYRDQVDDRAHVRVVEVPTTHVGMPLAPEVWLLVAEALAG